MHPHSYLKAFCPLPLDFHSRCRPRVHCFYQPYHSPLHSQPSQRPPQNLSRHSIERFLQIHKSHPQFSSLLQTLLLHLPYYKHCICSPSSWHKSKMHVINANPPLHYLPFPDHFITQLRHPPYPIFPHCFKHLCHYSRGPRCLLLFYSPNRLPHLFIPKYYLVTPPLFPRSLLPYFPPTFPAPIKFLVHQSLVLPPPY